LITTPAVLEEFSGYDFLRDVAAGGSGDGSGRDKGPSQSGGGIRLNLGRDGQIPPFASSISFVSTCDFAGSIRMGHPPQWTWIAEVYANLGWPGMRMGGRSG